MVSKKISSQTFIARFQWWSINFCFIADYFYSILFCFINFNDAQTEPISYYILIHSPTSERINRSRLICQSGRNCPSLFREVTALICLLGIPWWHPVATSRNKKLLSKNFKTFMDIMASFKRKRKKLNANTSDISMIACLDKLCLWAGEGTKLVNSHFELVEKRVVSPQIGFPPRFPCQFFIPH